MQLVLNDQGGRQTSVQSVLPYSEYRSGLGFPGQHCKLVHRADDEVGRRFENVLINHHDRQRGIPWTGGIESELAVPVITAIDDRLSVAAGRLGQLIAIHPDTPTCGARTTCRLLGRTEAGVAPR